MFLRANETIHIRLVDVERLGRNPILKRRYMVNYAE